MEIRDVFVLDDAVADLENGRTFYEERQSGLGDYFWDTLLSDLESLTIYGVHGGKMGGPEPFFQSSGAAMRVISKKPIREFWERHPESKPALEEWFREVGQFTAASFPELRQAFRSADYVDGYTVFDVGGNKYLIATVIHYDKQRLYVRQVMTHAEYDRNAWRKK